MKNCLAVVCATRHLDLFRKQMLLNLLWSQVKEYPFDFLKTFTKLLAWRHEKLFSCGMCNKILGLIQEANVTQFPMIPSQGKSFWFSKDFHKLLAWRHEKLFSCGMCNKTFGLIQEADVIEFPMISSQGISFWFSKNFYKAACMKTWNTV